MKFRTYIHSYEEVLRKIIKLNNYKKSERLYVIYSNKEDIFDYAETRGELVVKYLSLDKEKLLQSAKQGYVDSTRRENSQDFLRRIIEINKNKDINYFTISTRTITPILKSLHRIIKWLREGIEYEERVMFLEDKRVKESMGLKRL